MRGEAEALGGVDGIARVREADDFAGGRKGWRSLWGIAADGARVRQVGFAHIGRHGRRDLHQEAHHTQGAVRVLDANAERARIGARLQGEFGWGFRRRK